MLYCVKRPSSFTENSAKSFNLLAKKRGNISIHNYSSSGYNLKQHRHLYTSLVEGITAPLDGSKMSACKIYRGLPQQLKKGLAGLQDSLILLPPSCRVKRSDGNRNVEHLQREILRAGPPSPPPPRHTAATPPPGRTDRLSGNMWPRRCGSPF